MKKKTKKQVKCIWEPLYRFNIWYYEGYTYKEFVVDVVKENKELEGLLKKDAVDGQTVIINDYVYGLYLDKGLTDIPVLCHEMIHLARFVLTERGLPFNAEGDEVITYLVEYLLRRMLNGEWNKKGKIKYL